MTSFKFHDFLQVPLVVGGIGIVCLARPGGRMNLLRATIASIEVFCQRVAGALHGANLLRAAQDALKQAQEERRKSENLLEHVLPEMAASDNSMTASRTAARSLLDLERNACRVWRTRCWNFRAAN